MPNVQTEEIRRVAGLIAQLYEYNGVGGNAHIVTDDWNLETDHIEFCLEQVAVNPHGYCAAQLAIEKDLLEAMLKMSEDERASALALHDGFYEPVPAVPPAPAIIFQSATYKFRA